MCLAGVSVRRVKSITEALWETKVSPGTFSKLNKRIYSHIEKWRTRPITGTYAYVYLDGVVLKRSWGGEVRNISVLVAFGVDVESIGEFYPEAQWQSCTVHFYRKVFSQARRGKVAEVSRMLKAIHAREDLAAAHAVMGKLRVMKLRSAADLVERIFDQTLT